MTDVPGGGGGWSREWLMSIGYDKVCMLYVKSEIPKELFCSHKYHIFLYINVDHLELDTAFVNNNRRLCAGENRCFGHDQFHFHFILS